MAMRSAIYDNWVEQEIQSNSNAVVLPIGCGLDSRIERVRTENAQWYDIDFQEVIAERRKYCEETGCYHMLAADMRKPEWKKDIDANQDAIIILEGVSMYFEPDELVGLLSSFSGYFKSVRLMMDCYTQQAAKASKYKNPINDVGVTVVYGYDNPQELAQMSGLAFEKEYSMTPQKYIDELQGLERAVFQHLFAGQIAKSMYRLYEFKKDL